jgi:hypothetical protein
LVTLRSALDLTRASGRWDACRIPSLRGPVKFAVDLVEDVVGGFGPDERVTALVSAGDERPDLDHQVAGREEAAAVDGLLLDMPNQASTRLSQDSRARKFALY